jgi:hypothetical protein
MGVPDKTYFGDNPWEAKGISYGEVRQIKIEGDLIMCLKGRLDAILINQIKPLAEFNKENRPNIWSPFPLNVLTLLAIETLGRVICNIEKIEEENQFETTKIISSPIYKLMYNMLSYKPSKVFIEAFEKLHGKFDKKSMTNYSDVIIKFQRNTFIHGYQARGVYLDDAIEDAVSINDGEGYLVINPYKFWNRYLEIYENVFSEILLGRNPQLKNNAIIYIRKLIN